jgi:hypothetical protein
MEKDSKPLNTLSYKSLNSNTWNLNNFENIFCEHLGCQCHSDLGFSFLYSKSRVGIDVVAPAGISVPKFSDFKLAVVDISYPIVMCLGCKEIYKVIPDFITTGTTLTLAAQALVSVLYHATINGTWRKLNDSLGGSEQGIAHTTLYRAYHSFGKNLLSMKDRLAIIIEENSPSGLNIKIPKKARKDHTKKRETMLIVFLMILLLSLTEELKIFWRNYWKLLEVLTSKTTYNEAFKNTQKFPKKLDTS